MSEEEEEEKWQKVERKRGWKEKEKDDSKEHLSFAEAAGRGIKSREAEENKDRKKAYPKSGLPGFKE
jgi:hypothetical protein